MAVYRNVFIKVRPNNDQDTDHGQNETPESLESQGFEGFISGRSEIVGLGKIQLYQRFADFQMSSFL